MRLRLKVMLDLSLRRRFEALLNRNRTFVLITDRAPGGRHEETVEECKARALFFEEIRVRFAALCAGDDCPGAGHADAVCLAPKRKRQFERGCRSRRVTAWRLSYRHGR